MTHDLAKHPHFTSKPPNPPECCQQGGFGPERAADDRVTTASGNHAGNHVDLDILDELEPTLWACETARVAGKAIAGLLLGLLALASCEDRMPPPASGPMTLHWQELGDGMDRARVKGGWFVRWRCYRQAGLTFYPDPEHEWLSEPARRDG